MVVFHGLLGEGEIGQRVLEVVWGGGICVLLYFFLLVDRVIMALDLCIIIIFLHLEDICSRNESVEQTVSTLASNLIANGHQDILEVHNRVMQGHGVLGQS